MPAHSLFSSGVFLTVWATAGSLVIATSLGLAQEAAPSKVKVAKAGDSPWWRAHVYDTGAGDVPITWGPDQNIAWKIDLPGRGRSTPCIVGNQIILSTGIDDPQQIRLVSYDRQTGLERWNRLVHEGGFMHTHEKNTHATGTPACDGERVFVAHMLKGDQGDGVYVTAVGLDGNIVWQKHAGPFETQHGYSPSPVLYGDTVIVLADSPHKQSFVAAFDQATGKEVWRTPRGGVRNYSCPSVVHVAGRDQLLILGIDYTVSYDPGTGKEIWRAKGPSSATASTVVADDVRVYASGGHPEKNLIAVRADGNGDVTQTHIAWKQTKAICYVPSMLPHNGMLFTVNDEGIANCYDAATGEQIWMHRIGGNFSSSPILVGENIFVSDEEGKIYVFKAAREYVQVAVNNLDDGGFATPVVLQGKIYLRTEHHLWCIAK